MFKNSSFVDLPNLFKLYLSLTQPTYQIFKMYKEVFTGRTRGSVYLWGNFLGREFESLRNVRPLIFVFNLKKVKMYVNIYELSKNNCTF